MQSFPFDSELTYDEHDNPIYDRAVSSQPLRKLIRELFTTGIMPNPSTNLQVSAGNDGMTVQIAAGFAVIDGGLCHETETRTLEVTAADNTYDRIDTVVLRWNENVDVRTADLYVIAGTPAVNPVRPTLQRNNSIYEIGLADVFITKRVATITNDKITDTRYEAERCGIVSSISEFDTTTLYQQVQSDLVRFKRNEENTYDSWANDQQTSAENWITEQQADFISWVQSIKDMLDEDAAGHLQNEIDAIRPRVTTNLLNPSLFTIANIATGHGLTITNNGDGTFTVNGTTDNNVGSDGRIAVNITTWGADTEIATGHSQIKLCGTPSSVNKTGMLQLADYNSDNDTQWRSDLGDGVVINTVDSKVKIYALRFEFLPNTTFDNAVFKPMLTADLQATYDDYVQYSGDGELNENVADLYPVKHRTITNLLDSELDTKTVNGITCIDNGDGTYTLNGTATSNVSLVLRKNIKLKENVRYKVEGCPKGGGGSTYKIGLYGQKSATSFDGQLACSPQVGNTIEKFKPNNTLYPYGYGIQIVVYKGTTINNLIFKPMITTDLTATYDDYVQYSGDGELNENVAISSKQLTLTKNSIAPTEENTFATEDHNQGDYFYVTEDEKLYRALVDIYADDSIDEGSNVEEITVGAEMSALFDTTGRISSQLLASDGQKFQFAKSGNKYGYKINGVFYPFDKVQVSKAVTASTSALTVTPDSGYDGIASVTVNPQPHTATRATVTSNGTIDLGTNHATRYVPVNISPRLVGTYSANTTINISSLGATSASQFLIVCDTEASGSTFSWNTMRDYNRILSSHYYPPSITSFSSSSLTLSVGKIIDYVQADDDGHPTGTVYVYLSTKVYFIG